MRPTIHNAELKQHYLDYLPRIAPDLLNGSRHGAALSGLFLSFLPSDQPIAATTPRILVVGSETAGWPLLKQPFTDLADYLERAKAFYFRCFSQETASRGTTFLNFMRKARHTYPQYAFIYANLFCFDWQRGSPINSPAFNEIRQHSSALLNLLIDYTQPDQIVFANGISNAKYRREFIAMQPDSGTLFTEHGIPDKHLWAFKTASGIPCYRIQHPAARRRNKTQAHLARQAQTYVIQQLSLAAQPHSDLE
ncbi:hypothetical protein [Laribacter hongkongensis]|uniref:hypothetical protein n=1 Tax=Laribacter hongkongensis TaxID=168471 RepID=UPI001EFE7C94|nr:hypothetical protein [Laribacter hongkongensis]MCG9031774.1 hypothetical protein [Laribacter hongkongensis]MCG9064768.1 hypothetical protein [Laribacter hongkongensis]MCG9091692.1 hypothetical protein [Laribacter hongkongensis]